MEALHKTTSQQGEIDPLRTSGLLLRGQHFVLVLQHLRVRGTLAFDRNQLLRIGVLRAVDLAWNQW